MNEFLNGWLSPKGKFFSCDYMGHLSKAMEIYNQLGRPSVRDNSVHGFPLRNEPAIEKLGYVKLTGLSSKESHIFFPEIWYKTRTTKTQINWLYDNRVKLSENQLMDLNKYTKAMEGFKNE